MAMVILLNTNEQIADFIARTREYMTKTVKTEDAGRNYKDLGLTIFCFDKIGGLGL